MRESDEIIIKNPKGLLRKVWFDILKSFGRGGNEYQRQLTIDTFYLVLTALVKSYRVFQRDHDTDDVFQNLRVKVDKNDDTLYTIRPLCAWCEQMQTSKITYTNTVKVLYFVGIKFRGLSKSYIYLLSFKFVNLRNK